MGTIFRRNLPGRQTGETERFFKVGQLEFFSIFGIMRFKFRHALTGTHTLKICFLFTVRSKASTETERQVKSVNEEFITFTIGKQKTIALIAHDGKKREMIDWCAENQEILKGHFLCGTGTTAKLVAEKTGLPVKGYNSGLLGGDQQIGAKIVEGSVDFVVFFSDPLEAQPHDPDVKALLRIAQVYDIPIANNRATADFLIHSDYMSREYQHKVINFKQSVIDRVNDENLFQK